MEQITYIRSFPSIYRNDYFCFGLLIKNYFHECIIRKARIYSKLERSFVSVAFTRNEAFFSFVFLSHTHGHIYVLN